LTVIYPGVPDTLERLASAGLDLVVCTNKHEASARHILAALGLAQHIRHLVGGDSLPFRKPDPRVITLTLETLGVPAAAAVLVGDSEVDGATAEGAGVDFILMTYGYHHGPLEATKAWHRLDRFADLIPILA
jgi:phosphoglycolate phosphatase